MFLSGREFTFQGRIPDKKLKPIIFLAYLINFHLHAIMLTFTRRSFSNKYSWRLGPKKRLIPSANINIVGQLTFRTRLPPPRSAAGLFTPRTTAISDDCCSVAGDSVHVRDTQYIFEKTIF